MPVHYKKDPHHEGLFCFSLVLFTALAHTAKHLM